MSRRLEALQITALDTLSVNGSSIGYNKSFDLDERSVVSKEGVSMRNNVIEGNYAHLMFQDRPSNVFLPQSEIPMMTWSTSIGNVADNKNRLVLGKSAIISYQGHPDRELLSPVYQMQKNYSPDFVQVHEYEDSVYRLLASSPIVKTAVWDYKINGGQQATPEQAVNAEVIWMSHLVSRDEKHSVALDFVFVGDDQMIRTTQAEVSVTNQTDSSQEDLIKRCAEVHLFMQNFGELNALSCFPNGVSVRLVESLANYIKEAKLPSSRFQWGDLFKGFNQDLVALEQRAITNLVNPQR